MKRSVEPRFSSEEKLYRGVAKDQLRGSIVKPSALSLQISVNRQHFESAEQVHQRALQSNHRKFNGVAQISVKQARGCHHGQIRVSCIDEPTRDLPAHALIALWTEASLENEIDVDVEHVRVLLARELKVEIPPKE